MTKVEKLTKDIESHYIRIKELENLRQKICRHKNIEEDSYRQDEWAFPNKYTTAYKCKDCDLYSSSDINDDNFKKLDKLYKKRLWKE